MDFSVSHEAGVFLCSCLCGAFIGVVYDIFARIRAFCEKKCLFADILDIVFWICASGTVFTVIFFSNNGYVRGYEFLGIFLGLIIYFFALSKPFLAFFELFLRVFSKIFKVFLKILLTPFIFLYNIVFEGIMFIFKPVYKVLCRLFRFLISRARFYFKAPKIKAKKVRPAGMKRRRYGKKEN